MSTDTPTNIVETIGRVKQHIQQLVEVQTIYQQMVIGLKIVTGFHPLTPIQHLAIIERHIVRYDETIKELEQFCSQLQASTQ